MFSQSLPRAPVTCAPVWTDSTLTLTPLSATSSTPVLTARLRSTPAHPDSGSTSTAVSATGQRPRTGRSAKLRPTVSWLPQTRTIFTRRYFSSRDCWWVPVSRQRSHRWVWPVRPPPQVRWPQRLRQVLHLPERHLPQRAGMRAWTGVQWVHKAVRCSWKCTWVVSSILETDRMTDLILISHFSKDYYAFLDDEKEGASKRRK